MHYILTACLLALTLPVSTQGQIASTTPNLATALLTAKSGDIQSAVSQVTNGISRLPAAGHEDLQVGRALLYLSLNLRESSKDSAKAKELAAMALGKLNQPEGRMPSREATMAHLATAQLHDLVYGDLAKAKAAYERALQIEPNVPWAKERIQQITGIQRNIQDKSEGTRAVVERVKAQRK